MTCGCQYLHSVEITLHQFNRGDYIYVEVQKKMVLSFFISDFLEIVGKESEAASSFQESDVVKEVRESIEHQKRIEDMELKSNFYVMIFIINRYRRRICIFHQERRNFHLR